MCPSTCTLSSCECSEVLRVCEKLDDAAHYINMRMKTLSVERENIGCTYHNESTLRKTKGSVDFEMEELEVTHAS